MPADPPRDAPTDVPIDVPTDIPADICADAAAPARDRPVSVPVGQPAAVLRADLHRVRSVLIEAELAAHPVERHAAAQRAALGVAAVVLALRGVRVRSRRNVWQLLASASPEYAEWAGFFAATAQVPGQPRPISPREADDLIRDAGSFADLVGRAVTAVEARRDFRAPGAVR